MFNRILVPLDGSTLAERVLPHVEKFARIFGSTIVLLQVLDPTSFHENPSPVNPLNWQIRKTEADMYLHSISTRISNDLHGVRGLVDPDTNTVGEIHPRVEFHIREGKTAENIVNFAHAENIDLVAICTHGSGGLSRWNISSVTQKVITMIYLPVLLIRAYNSPESEDSAIHYRRILLPIDSSRRAETALSAGVAIARGEKALSTADEVTVPASVLKNNATKLILAAVIKPPEIALPEPYPVEIEQLSQQLIDVSRQAVGTYLKMMGKRLPVTCETMFLEDNSVASAIHELANQHQDIDLVILSAHGSTGKFTWPYGSVTRNYLEHGTKPVLVIQDIPRSQVLPTAAEIAAEKSGGRQL
jgi:nucleotide-binding universal stress UspA family protein